ncbi:DUF4157 domain-containing protein [Paenibacillus sp. R14(2021)]|uniref:eCIS core domain-containing protein n=1 Tax=Paenibacillus sp. R14(2021) TaxID=2859228 RepID=UPI001C616534|nr:DUF4157 domain-containing protein [Paenibacillus sp. R14(2021)]
MSKQPSQAHGARGSRNPSSGTERESSKPAAKTDSSGGRIQTGQGPLSAGSIIQMQRTMGNRALGQWLQSGQSERASGSAAPIQRKENRTGMPDHLKSGVEQLSGMSMDDVKVHYNSQKPAEVEAHAYAQGTDIFVGPGQEKHLPHEAWHVVQQQEGRVAPTMEHNGEAINDDESLESEADQMGAKALQADSDT